MKDRARDTKDDPLQRVLDEVLAEGPGPRDPGLASLRARLVSRLYFAGFQVIEEIGTVGERTVPFVLGVKGRPRSSSRAVLVAATLRPGLRAPLKRPGRPVASDDSLQSPLLPTGAAGVACALAAMARLREAEVNRPLVFLVAFDEAEQGSALLPVRERYGLDVATALLLHPTEGRVALASPGRLAVDVALRRSAPEWSVASLQRTLRLRSDASGAGARLLQALAEVVRQGGAAFEPCLRWRGAREEASALVAAPPSWEPPGLFSAEPEEPTRLGRPLGLELTAAAEIAARLMEGHPGLGLHAFAVEGDTLRLQLTAVLPPEADLARHDALLERVQASLPGWNGLEVEVAPSLHRPPFVAGQRARALAAEKAPGQLQEASPVPSEAGFAGTPDVLLLGPEGLEQGTGMDRVRATTVTDLLERLLVRLLG